MQCIWSEQGQLPAQAQRIRRDVFMQEQGFCDEFDVLDKKSWHVLLQTGGKTIGTARMFWEQNDVMHVGRVAVCKDARGGGNGARILQACCEKAKTLGAKRVILGAQCRAVEFYKKSGFTPYGEIFDDEGCPHQMMEKKIMSFLDISEEIRQLGVDAEKAVRPYFDAIDEISEYNTEKVLAAFAKNRVAEAMFAGTTGYGYDDKGRDTLDQIYADIFGTEAALVRIGFVNGTHALCCAMYSAVKTGDVVLSATGPAYDTLMNTITGDMAGSMKQYGIGYRQVEMKNGLPDVPAIVEAAKAEDVKLVFIQRSKGYGVRESLSCEQIGEVCQAVRAVNPNAVIMVDNCYGEFVEKLEPTQVGADIIAGSLIKNPGGGLAPTGGYIAGRKDLVENASFRLTAPGIGAECGCTMGQNRLLYQGLFMAPHTTAQAIKTAVFGAQVMQMMGFEVHPLPEEPRHDIIQTIAFGKPEPLCRFCEGIQAGAPVDSFVTPVPWDMPGYQDQVIMAAGAFVQGASIELSADAPMREPYVCYMQGGLTYASGKMGVLLAAQRIHAAGYGK